MEQAAERLTMNVAEVAHSLGISLPKAYELANRADFPSIRMGRRVIVPKREFIAWLQAYAYGNKAAENE